MFINACRLLPALPSLSQFGGERLSLVAISFYALPLLFGPCRLSEFTLAGSHTPLGTATAAKTSLLKWNKRVLKLCSVYSNLLKMSNIGKFSWSVDFLGPHSSSERERKFRGRLFTSSIKREIRHFHVVVV